MKAKFIILFLILFFFSKFNIEAQDPWIIRADTIDSKNYYGTSVSNGTIGVVSSPEPFKVKEVILAGVYDRFGRGRTSNFLSGFNLLDMNISLGWQNINSTNITNYKQELDMQNAMFKGSFDFNDIASVNYVYYAVRHLPHTVIIEVSITPYKDTHLVAENILTTPSSFRDDNLYYNEINPSHAYIPLLTTVAKSPSGKITSVASNTFIFEEKHGDEPKVLHEMRDSNSHLMKFVKKLNKGEVYSFSLVGSLTSTIQTEDPYNQAERMSIYANLQGVKELKKQHISEWKKLWENDIIIEGDDQAQQDVHNMLYQLYSFSNDKASYSLSPMGLSGTGYNGHIFWDTEIWMYPVFLMLKPEVAKMLIEYRYQRLDKAIRNAQNHGYQGAMYPWESASSGEEETPVWALSGTYEHHITGDVGIAAWQYYLATQDKEWLKQRGWDILKNTALFWQSRVSLEKGKYSINNVVCADEWAENVNNNAFTNAVAKLNLEYAIECAKTLNYKPNTEWKLIADNLVFNQMNNGVTKEHDSYNGEKIKQADVNLLAYPLKVITNKDQIAKDLEYYKDKVPYSDTPAMTQAIFTLLYSRLGDAKNAGNWFKESYEKNLLPPFRVMAETKGGTNPYFITGAGGILQSIIMGFAGVTMTDKGEIVQENTAMPLHWKKLTIKGVGKNKITITKQNQQ